eukprot:gnl/TRDRNA2_/TRDRNA2_188609_c0_seq1.p1 gnl/TRDRNA2_/TRDRNA2_188609_c0~~gnl/TRDRNA2_/TRDRNA2_188609_c0_seq1.p1  ORF type:complete len:225 (+),score=73.05 gnl/TRDRNA2_/TRDRNA2_188609_c0_seq1:83-757(+)
MPPTDEAKEEENRHWAAVAFRGCIEQGKVDEVDQLLLEGANPTYKMTDGSSWNVLMLAANCGHTVLVDKFTSKRGFPKVEDHDPHGTQAIMLAALKGHKDIVQTLLDKKADATCTNKDGETPLMMAAASGHTEVVKLLLGASADPDASDKHDMTAIKKAARWGHAECVKELLTKVKDDARQRKHCLLFGKLYGHEGVMKIFEPPPAAEDGAAAVQDAEAAVAKA